MDFVKMFIDSSWIGKTVVFILLGLSVYSIAVMIDKFRTYKAARDQSLQFLPVFVKNLKDENFQGALERPGSTRSRTSPGLCRRG
jgi:hypothetical protein